MSENLFFCENLADAHRQTDSGKRPRLTLVVNSKMLSGMRSSHQRQQLASVHRLLTVKPNGVPLGKHFVSPTLVSPFAPASSLAPDVGQRIVATTTNSIDSSVHNSKMSMSMSKEIEELRDHVLTVAADHPLDFYDSDLARVRSSDWQVNRFIIKTRASRSDTRSVDKAKEDMVQNLKWRKTVRLLDRTESTFPSDFFLAGLIGSGVCQRTGDRVIYINTKVYRKIPELTEHFYAFGHTFLDRLDRESKG